MRLRRKNDGVGRSYYDELGLPRDADEDAVKRAYRRLSRELHPDVSDDPEAEARFRQISEAHAVLSRPDARRLYDRWGWRGRGRGFERRRGAIYSSNKRGFLQDLESLIAAATGRKPDREPTQVVGSVEVDAYEAHIGATRTVELPSEQPCRACDGTGHGREISNSDSGRFLSLVRCPDCDGSGAAGAMEARAVPVPPGVRDLDRIPVGPEAVAIVKIVPARDRFAVRSAAFGGLLVALGFLLFLLSL